MAKPCARPCRRTGWKSPEVRLAALAGRVPSADARACYQALDAAAPDDYRQLAALLVDDWRVRGMATVGIGGGQGAGKSTLGALIEAAGARLGRRVVVLGIDDYYLTRAERRRLAETVHPLLATRGPPGTHAVGAVRQALFALREPGEVRVPRFDKGTDDRAGFRTLRGPADVVALEGWCVGASPASGSVAEAINALERERDPHGQWRQHVEQALRGEYARLHAALDALVFLQVPDLNAVRRWRLQQEQQRPPAQRMTCAEVGHFVAHYERVTRRMVETLPRTADTVVELNAAHRVTALRFQSGGAFGSAGVPPA